MRIILCANTLKINKMKKLTIILAAVVMGFVMTSCGGSAKSKDAIMNDVNKYFAEAEEKLAAIDNVYDFLDFVEVMSDRSDLTNMLEEKYGDVTMTDEEQEELLDKMYDRATAYNEVEALKCAEYLTPAVDALEAAINNLYAKFQAGEALDDESVENFVDAFVDVLDFSEYDNVPHEISERIDALMDKVDEMSDVLEARIDELYPEEM